MKVACMQMDMKFGCPEINFLHAEKLICEAVKEQPDVLVLPETWNTGFFPKEDLTSLCCKDGEAVKSRIGILAKKLGITFEEMKQMSFVSLINILLSSVQEHENKATQEDIDRMFG